MAARDDSWEGLVGMVIAAVVVFAIWVLLR